MQIVVHPVCIMTIAAYIRISSGSQNKASQCAEVKKWLSAHGHDLEAVQWFEDAESGADLERQGFKDLEAAIFAGTIKTVVVWKLDRLARSMLDGINTLSAWCSKGVRVVSVTQQIDLSGPVGHLIASVLFGIAEIEREYIRERQRIGIDAAKKRGVYKGAKKGSRKAAPERAKKLKAKGLTADEIAAALNISRRTVFNYLKEQAATFRY